MSMVKSLHILRDDIDEKFERKMPVFQPKYSRRSLMTFMLSEVLMQALMQINSPAQRAKLEHSKAPRFLRSIILTVPPAMPKPEREIFRQSIYQAIGLVWKSLGWDKSDDDFDFNSQSAREKYWPILPEVIIQWDEATCGQVVYLFNETQNNYGVDQKNLLLHCNVQIKKKRIVLLSQLLISVVVQQTW